MSSSASQDVLPSVPSLAKAVDTKVVYDKNFEPVALQKTFKAATTNSVEWKARTFPAPGRLHDIRSLIPGRDDKTLEDWVKSVVHDSARSLTFLGNIQRVQGAVYGYFSTSPDLSDHEALAAATTRWRGMLTEGVAVDGWTTNTVNAALDNHLLVVKNALSGSHGYDAFTDFIIPAVLPYAQMTGDRTISSVREIDQAWQDAERARGNTKKRTALYPQSLHHLQVFHMDRRDGIEEILDTVKTHVNFTIDDKLHNEITRVVNELMVYEMKMLGEQTEGWLNPRGAAPYMASNIGKSSVWSEERLSEKEADGDHMMTEKAHEAARTYNVENPFSDKNLIFKFMEQCEKSINPTEPTSVDVSLASVQTFAKSANFDRDTWTLGEYVPTDMDLDDFLAL